MYKSLIINLIGESVENGKKIIEKKTLKLTELVEKI